MRALRIDMNSPYRRLIGVGGIGTGIFFELEGDHTLGRNESRLGRQLDVRDYCKLHIVIHYVAKLLGAQPSGSPFHVLPIGRVGDDAPGHHVIQEMKEAGIDTSNVLAVAHQPTLFSVCFQYPDGNGGNITTNNSAAASLCDADLDAVAELLEHDGENTLALAVPEVSLPVRRYFLKLATKVGAFRAASFARAEVGLADRGGMFDMLDLVSLNEEEAGELVGCSFSPEQPELLIRECQQFLRTSCPQLRMVVSIGKAGAYGVTSERWHHCPAAAVKVASTAGAGDSLLGGILAGIAAGIPFLPSADPRLASTLLGSALELGVVLASYKCLSPHTIHPSVSIDVLCEFARGMGYAFSPGIESLVAAQQP